MHRRSFFRKLASAALGAAAAVYAPKLVEPVRVPLRVSEEPYPWLDAAPHFEPWGNFVGFALDNVDEQGTVAVLVQGVREAGHALREFRDDQGRRVNLPSWYVEGLSQESELKRRWLDGEWLDG